MCAVNPRKEHKIFGGKMASIRDDTGVFFLNGSSKQFDHVLKLYPQVLKVKADQRTKKPEELIRLDDW